MPMSSLEDNLEQKRGARFTSSGHEASHRVDRDAGHSPSLHAAAKKRTSNAKCSRDSQTTRPAVVSPSNIVEKVPRSSRAGGRCLHLAAQQERTARANRRNAEEDNDSSLSSKGSADDEEARPGAVSMPGTGLSSPAGTVRPQLGREQSSSNAISIPIAATLANDDSDLERLEAEKEALRRELEQQRDTQHIAAAEIVFGDDRSAQSPQATRRALLVTLLLVVAVAIVLIVVFLQDQDENPGDTLNSRYPDLFRLFNPISGDALNDKNSPQTRAIDWLAQDEFSSGIPIDSPQNKKILEERYALAVLYFSTGNDSSAAQTGWSNKYNFLGGKSVCSWNDVMAENLVGVACDDRDAVARVRLSSNGLEGVLPSELSLLDGLTDLALGDNNLMGTLPAEIGLLTSLQLLELNNNALSGVIPTDIGLLTSLSRLNLGDNMMTGTVPTEVLNLSQLQVARFEYNLLTGRLDWTDWCSSARSASNQLITDCSIECNCCTSCCRAATQECEIRNGDALLEFFADKTGASVFIPGTPSYLAAQWILSSYPLEQQPDELRLLQHFIMALFYFATSDNGQSPWRSCNPPGEDDDDTCTFEKVTEPSESVEGADSPCISPGNNVWNLQAGSCQGDNIIIYTPKPDRIRWLTGHPVCNWAGVACSGGSDVVGIFLFGQNLTGTLPSELATLPFLQQVSLAYNELAGTIPTEYGSVKDLLALELRGNKLTGTIPTEFYEQAASSLVVFNVGDNKLEGTIDTRVGLMTDLKQLHLFDNDFSGALPNELANLSQLVFARFNGNRFVGTFPTGLGRLVKLTELWAHENEFTGTIPAELGNLRRLSDLRLWGSEITGEIPQQLYDLRKLFRLSLHAMALTGTLSTSVGQLTELQILKVSANQLVGTIPSEIASLARLRVAWLHLNQFAGIVPPNICDNKVGPGGLEFVVADCLPEEDPHNYCSCCSVCCNPLTRQCTL